MLHELSSSCAVQKTRQMAGRRKAALAAGAAAAGLAACAALVALHGGRRAALVARVGPPVEYVRADGARRAPPGMHVEYVPGLCGPDA